MASGIQLATTQFSSNVRLKKMLNGMVALTSYAVIRHTWDELPQFGLGLNRSRGNWHSEAASEGS
jgi:hypothetical protein